MNNEDYARYSGKLAHAQGIMESIKAAINNDYKHKHIAEPLATAIDEVFTVRIILEHEIESAEDCEHYASLDVGPFDVGPIDRESPIS